MGSYGHAQILGFARDVQGVVTKERTSLKAAGVDADAVVAGLKALQDQTEAFNVQQESLKRQLKATTAAYSASRLKLYTACSGALDTAMAAVEKNSAAAKNMQRLRSRIRKPRGPSQEVPLPQPLPPS
jgi:hypothetical protein